MSLMNVEPMTPDQMREAAESSIRRRNERDYFDGKDQVSKLTRPTRVCSTCGEKESPRRDLRPTQFIADPKGLKLTPTGVERWQNLVHWACQPCRRRYQGCWRIPSYHPTAGVADFQVTAQQLVPGVRVITLLEPFAWLVAQGFKTCENRGWNTNFTGRIFIHSGKSFSPSFRTIENMVGTHHGIMLPGMEWLRANHMGRLVAVADFGPMQTHLPHDPWKIKGNWAWPITWCHSIKPSEIVRGMQGLWFLPTDNMRVSVSPL